MMRLKAVEILTTTIIKLIYRYFTYETAVGMNGVVWIRAQEIIEMIIIRNAILNSVLLDDINIEAMVDALAIKAKRHSKS